MVKIPSSEEGLILDAPLHTVPPIILAHPIPSSLSLTDDDGNDSSSLACYVENQIYYRNYYYHQRRLQRWWIRTTTSSVIKTMIITIPGIMAIWVVKQNLTHKKSESAIEYFKSKKQNERR